MISEGVAIAYLGKISHGIHAGRFLPLIGESYLKIVEASLEQVVNAKGIKRGQFFKDVFLVSRDTSDLAHQPETGHRGY